LVGGVTDDELHVGVAAEREVTGRLVDRVFGTD
jgi:hypothetical protein